MAYVNTGYARNKTLTVTKGLYSRSYDLCSEITPVEGGRVFPSISDDGLSKLSKDNYNQRLEEFIRYVYSLESGLQSDCPNMSVGSVVYNTTLCPIPASDKASVES